MLKNWMNGLKGHKLAIRIIGDHSAYHCGSAAAWGAIRDTCARAGRIIGDGEDYDVLVINGEGAMHHNSNTCLNTIAQIDAAIKAGKRVHLMNTVWQGNAQKLADVLKSCESVTTREVLSQAELKKAGVESSVSIDQSFLMPVDKNAPLVDFKNGPVLTDFYSTDLGTFAKVMTKWTWTVPYIQMHEWDWPSLVNSLPTANVLLTGRHHTVYAACKARVPFLALKGNTHKIEGLIATSGCDIPVFSKYKDLLKTYRSGAWEKINFEPFFDWMHAQKPWELPR